MQKSHYQILGVVQNASSNVIDEAHARLRAVYLTNQQQGDSSSANELVGLTGAYEILRNPEKRTAYDEKLANMQQNAAKASARNMKHAEARLANCRTCGKEVSRTAKSCPHCGEESPVYAPRLVAQQVPNPVRATVGLIQAVFSLIVIVGLVIFFGKLFFGSSSDVAPVQSAPIPVVQSGSAGQREALKETAATILNMNGLLCAQVVNIRPLAAGNDTWEITCIEYRGRSGEKTYHMDALKARAWTP